MEQCTSYSFFDYVQKVELFVRLDDIWILITRREKNTFIELRAELELAVHQQQKIN